MTPTVHEIAAGIYRISSFVPEVGPEGFTFNQFLIVADEPLLFHTGGRGMFPLIAEAVASVMPLEKLRWISFGHVESDECGSMNMWLSSAPQSQVAFGRLGCSNRACHGSFQGAGGFRLSLFGSDPKMDFEGLKARVNPSDIDESLALLKATLQVPHKGGKRFDKDSWQYRAFKEWVAAGAPFEPGKEAVIERLEVTPSQQVFGKKGDKVQLTIRAYYSDRTVEDVTAQTLFSSNDDVVAGVSESGKDGIWHSTWLRLLWHGAVVSQRSTRRDNLSRSQQTWPSQCRCPHLARA